MKPKPFEIIVEFTPQSTKTGITYEMHQKGSLIRCKDCKYYDGHYCHNKWWGDGFGDYTSPAKAEDGFCDWAERRGETS